MILLAIRMVITAWLGCASEIITTSGPIRTDIIVVSYNEAPAPTIHALIGRTGMTKNCGYVNGELRPPLDCSAGDDCTHYGKRPSIEAPVAKKDQVLHLQDHADSKL